MLEVVEVAPRDGLQREAVILDPAKRAELIRRVARSGARRIEAVSFVSQRRVPQMAHAEAVLDLLRDEPRVSLIGLVLNNVGYQRARDTRIDEVNFVVLASETFNRENQGCPVAQSIAEGLAIAEGCASDGIAFSLTIGAAFGCPFEGVVPQDSVLRIVDAFAKTRMAELALADTIGVAGPSDIVTLAAAIRGILPAMPLRGHFHNTRNTGLANAYAAGIAGFASLDASLGGIGGCPFAVAATGNIPTEDLVYMLERNGVATGWNLDGLLADVAWLEEKLGHATPGMLAKAGNFPPQGGGVRTPTAVRR